jgi:hypothetical protein
MKNIYVNDELDLWHIECPKDTKLTNPREIRAAIRVSQNAKWICRVSPNNVETFVNVLNSADYSFDTMVHEDKVWIVDRIYPMGQGFSRIELHDGNGNKTWTLRTTSQLDKTIIKKRFRITD